MQMFKQSTKGLSLLFDLYWDRIVSFGALAAALLIAYWLVNQTGYYPIVERV